VPVDASHRLKHLLEANKERLRRQSNGEMLADILPSVTKLCSSFSVHVNDPIQRQVSRRAGAASGEAIDFEPFEVNGPADEIKHLLAVLNQRNHLSGWANVYPDGVDACIGVEVGDTPALVAELWSTCGQYLVDIWIASADADWIVHLYHEGTISLVRSDRQRR
jgi:hypothetical protein